MNTALGWVGFAAAFLGAILLLVGGTMAAGRYGAWQSPGKAWMDKWSAFLNALGAYWAVVGLIAMQMKPSWPDGAWQWALVTGFVAVGGGVVVGLVRFGRGDQRPGKAPES